MMMMKMIIADFDLKASPDRGEGVDGEKTRGVEREKGG